MNITLLGAHNLESWNTKFVSLLVNDNLVLDAGRLSSALSFQAQKKIKAILLTHQHYDHIKDIPAIAMNFYLSGATITLCSISPVYDVLATHMFYSQLYPNFLERPQENPTVKFIMIEPNKVEKIEGYSILTVPVNHSVPTVGYQVTSPDGKVLFYTGDTGPGLADCWQRISPQLMIIEVTDPSSYEKSARESGHLTPSLLKQELVNFKELKGYLPEVVTVHMNPDLEEEIRDEIAVVARELDSQITLGFEGMQLNL